jgi:hypothetical protein
MQLKELWFSVTDGYENTTWLLRINSKPGSHESFKWQMNESEEWYYDP